MRNVTMDLTQDEIEMLMESVDFQAEKIIEARKEYFEDNLEMEYEKEVEMREYFDDLQSRNNEMKNKLMHLFDKAGGLD